MVELKIMAYVDREKMVMALINSGYTVRVEERPDPKRYMSKEYYVVIEDVEMKEPINFHINIQSNDLTKTRQISDEIIRNLKSVTMQSTK